ncbi:hypothetical protein BHM03_00030789, partial [Ensete ventricosum]
VPTVIGSSFATINSYNGNSSHRRPSFDTYQFVYGLGGSALAQLLPVISLSAHSEMAIRRKKVHIEMQGQSFSAPPPPQPIASPKSGTDPLDMFFSSPAPAAAGVGVIPEAILPPTGIIAPPAKTKGLDTHKQEQIADAILWLSWAVGLLEKSGDFELVNPIRDQISLS